ncbi:MAG: neutral/alkaline non-lysosomal ceramidase N-terminal domain-containing protein [Pirellulaceae bacterium]|nr:neutral/alkaline non-lysosomal ceramidase N-terminal domain-containing protein [Pirellulaceae bacterium]
MLVSKLPSRWLILFSATVTLCLLPVAPTLAVDAGFGVVDITPAISADTPVWMAGYGQNRKAMGVHDPLYARAVVLRDGQQKVAIVVADVVGIFYPAVLEIRQQLPGFNYVMVAASHNHEGPDTMGLWGPSPFKSGVDPAYMKQLVDGCVQAVRDADAAAVACKASYGTAQSEVLLRDSRLPTVYDPVLRAVQFTNAKDGSVAGIVIQWNCHPEAMGPQNQQLTADFLYATIERLMDKHHCPVVAITGTVGGLMAPPRNVVKNDKGEFPGEGDFEYCRLYGEAVGDLALQAIQAAKPIVLTPFKVAAHQVALPMDNPVYKLGATLGLIRRDIQLFTDDFRDIGEPVDFARAKGTVAIVSEVACLQLGSLHVAGIPGEIYPELIYGQYQEPVEPNVDFPDANLEKPLVKILPSKEFLIVGLANDEVGYIIPKRQWDDLPPFAYQRTSKQYGEVNSIGPETAPIIMQAMEECVQELSKSK